MSISIHALVKRATETNHDTTWATVISIHALVKRATGCFGNCCFYSVYFNPRPREEGDILISSTTFCFILISIHALVKRATSDYTHGCQTADISIHALVKRATLLVSISTFVTGYFNPRPREEGDRIRTVCLRLRKYFNPRPREEGDNIFHRGTNHS